MVCPAKNRQARAKIDRNYRRLAITRYNYVYATLGAGSDEEDPPGTPTSGLWMDYEGAGRDQLLSTQKFVFNESEEVVRVEVETFSYLETHPHVASRERKTYFWDDAGEQWWHRLIEHTNFEYAYDRLQRQEYWYEAFDVEDDEYPIDDGSIGEYYAYDDLLGRRIGVFRCQNDEGTAVDYYQCKAQTMQYDYYGPSQRVAAERMSPFRYNGSNYINVGDEYMESYTYGPTGAAVRTNEAGDADEQTGWDDYVLPDLFGGTTGLLAYAEEAYDRELVLQHFDAFGVRLATTGAWGGTYESSRYRWRSQEGSETDHLHGLSFDPEAEITDVDLTPPYLVYMQTRNYDPALGRFLMADSIPMGAFSFAELGRKA